MIKKLEDMNDNEIRKLAEEYSQSYVNSAEILTGRKVDDSVHVFEDYTYRTVKKDIFKILNSIKKVHHKLPVVNFAAGGIATPADAAIMMQLGSDGVFVGSGIFKSDNPSKRAKAIVEAVANYNKPDVIAEVSKNLGEAMAGIEIETIPKEQLLQERGW
jgi:pyridoxal 5'-phosphate synthase pdxS subunit